MSIFRTPCSPYAIRSSTRSRLVPVGPQLVNALKAYAVCVVRNVLPWKGGNHPFWQTRTEQPLAKRTVQRRVYRSAFRCRGSRYSWQTTISVPSFAASQLRHTPGNSLVQARSRCTAAAADALHLSRSCGLGRHTSLPVDDTGTIARGLVAPGAFRRRRER